MKVLLTDGGHKNTLAVIRYLGRMKIEVHILHHKKSAPAYSRYCKRLIISPEINQSNSYFQFVIDLVKNENYDVLIPIGVIAVKLFSKNLVEIRKYINVELPEYSQVEIALNKAQTFKFAEKNNIPSPSTIYPTSLDEALLLVNKLSYPVIIKSSNESKFKFPTIYVACKKDLADSLELLEQKYPELKLCYPLIQERIFGKGYGFFAIYQEGKCKRVFMHERIRENPVSGGASTCAKSIFDEKLLEAGKRVLDLLNWHGQAMVEFKLDESNNTYKLIEINPKFWGSLELTLAAKMNFPYYLCQIAGGENLEYSENYKRGLIFQWIISTNGELYRLLKKPSDIVKVLFDAIKITSRNDIWFSDFKPVVMEMLYFMVHIKKTIFK